MIGIENKPRVQGYSYYTRISGFQFEYFDKIGEFHMLRVLVQDFRRKTKTEKGKAERLTP